MDNYPRMLYGCPALGIDTVALQEGTFDTLIVLDEKSHESAKAEGWHDTSPAAKDAHTDAIEAKLKATDNEPPTRAELEAKATEMGIDFKGTWGDKKLLSEIEAKLKA
jgi:hypothetical protein